MIAPLLVYRAKTTDGLDLVHQIGLSEIGLSQRGDHAKRFVHLDTKPRKAFWSY